MMKTLLKKFYTETDDPKATVIFVLLGLLFFAIYGLITALIEAATNNVLTLWGWHLLDQTSFYVLTYILGLVIPRMYLLGAKKIDYRVEGRTFHAILLSSFIPLSNVLMSIGMIGIISLVFACQPFRVVFKFIGRSTGSLFKKITTLEERLLR